MHRWVAPAVLHALTPSSRPAMPQPDQPPITALQHAALASSVQPFIASGCPGAAQPRACMVVASVSLDPMLEGACVSLPALDQRCRKRCMRLVTTDIMRSTLRGRADMRCDSLARRRCTAQWQ